MHHHCLWQVELLQLPQEVHPLMCFFGEADDFQLQLEGGVCELEELDGLVTGGAAVDVQGEE